MSNNYTVYEVEEPSNSFLRPDSMIGNVDGFVRGLLETPGREPRPMYNDLVITSSFLNILYFDKRLNFCVHVSRYQILLLKLHWLTLPDLTCFLMIYNVVGMSVSLRTLN